MLDGNSSVKLLFSYLNRRCRKPTGLPALYDKDGCIATDDHGKAEMLMESYKEFYSHQPAEVQVIDTPPDNTSLGDVEITVEKVRRAIKLLDVSKSNLEIGLNVKFLKELVDILAEPLTSIFQKSLRLTEFPLDWQKAYIRPIHKGGDPALTK